MKRKLLPAVILLSLVSLTFMSCEEILDLTDIPIETTLGTDVQATSAQAAGSSLKSSSEAVYAFEGTAVIDPTDDAEVEKYWEKIRNWEVQKIHNSIRTISMAATMLQGELIVTDKETEAVLFTKEVQNVSLSGGAEIMNIVDADYKKIISALEAKHSLVVTIRGNLDKPGVMMVFTLGFDVKIIANPLN
jgi:rRNA maturation endonuclease Nob1